MPFAAAPLWLWGIAKASNSSLRSNAARTARPRRYPKASPRASQFKSPQLPFRVPGAHKRPVLPAFERTPSDVFLRQLDASGRKWVIFVDEFGAPRMVLDAHHFLRDVLFNEVSVGPEPYWHRPIVVTDMGTRLGDVIGLMKSRSMLKMMSSITT